MKNDAEAYRKSEGLPPDATFKLEIGDRDDLAGLLNGLCGLEPPATPLMTELPAEVAERNQIDDPPDCVPKFLRDDWAKFKERTKL